MDDLNSRRHAAALTLQFGIATLLVERGVGTADYMQSIFEQAAAHLHDSDHTMMTIYENARQNLG